MDKLKEHYNLHKHHDRRKALHSQRLHLHKRPHIYFALLITGSYYTATQALQSYIGLHDFLFQAGTIIGLILWTSYEITRFVIAMWMFLRIKRWGL